MTIEAGRREVIHGSCVAFAGKAALLIGSSGSGKSATVLDLLTRGADLVADDQVVLSKNGSAIFAACVPGFEGKIEARGIGILQVSHSQDARVELIIDLDQTELQRLPPFRKHEILGVELDLIYGRDNWHLSAGVIARLTGTRAD